MSIHPQRLAGRAAIVSGGAGGIGRAVARRLLDEGSRVMLLDIDPAVRNAAAELGCAGALADVGDGAATSAAVARAEQEIGPLDIAVACAGVTLGVHVLDLDIADWNRLLAINLTGTFLFCQAAARVMAPRRRGAIVTTASVTAMRATTGRALYAATKGGVVSLTRGLAVDLAAHGIRVNCVAPGAIETPLAAAHHTGAAAGIRRLWCEQTPQGRYGEAGEVAAAVAFLVSDDAGFVTGQVLAVDGGFLAAGMLLDAKASP